MRLDTAPGRPDLHVSISAPNRLTVSQIAGGVQARFKLSIAEALTLADALVDAAEKMQGSQE